jgi:hypothetical protein
MEGCPPGQPRCNNVNPFRSTTHGCAGAQPSNYAGLILFGERNTIGTSGQPRRNNGIPPTKSKLQVFLNYFGKSLPSVRVRRVCTSSQKNRDEKSRGYGGREVEKLHNHGRRTPSNALVSLGHFPRKFSKRKPSPTFSVKESKLSLTDTDEPLQLGTT